MKNQKLYIISLYPYDDIYQVVDIEDDVVFQGSQEDCKKYKQLNK